MDFIFIYVINIEQKHPSSQYIITLPMTPIVNSYFNKHPMLWETIYRRLLHPSDSVMKAMCRHQTIDGLIKHCPNKLNKSPCKICYTAKMTTFHKGTTVDTSNLQPGENIHMKFALYNVTYVRGFTSMITFICATTIMLWLFPTVYKLAPVNIIRFIITTLNN